MKTRVFHFWIYELAALIQSLFEKLHKIMSRFFADGIEAQEPNVEWQTFFHFPKFQGMYNSLENNANVGFYTCSEFSWLSILSYLSRDLNATNVFFSNRVL